VLACIGFFGYRIYTQKKARKAGQEKPGEGQGTTS
jgi:hypothetical protein